MLSYMLTLLMGKKIVFYEDYFIKFYKKQDKATKEKIQYVFSLVQQLNQVPKKFLKHLSGTDGLYEIRVKSKSNIYRIFCCFDQGDLIVLLNCFQKKTQKTPKREIKKALELKRKYFEERNNDKKI